MKNSNYIIILLLILNLGCNNNKADLIVINSKIYTANKANFVAQEAPPPWGFLFVGNVFLVGGVDYLLLYDEY